MPTKSKKRIILAGWAIVIALFAYLVFTLKENQPSTKTATTTDAMLLKPLVGTTTPFDMLIHDQGQAVLDMMAMPNPMNGDAWIGKWPKTFVITVAVGCEVTWDQVRSFKIVCADQGTTTP